MAEKDIEQSKQSKKAVPKKKVQTVRERTAKGQSEKPRRIRKTARKAVVPIASARRLGQKEYHLPLPDNKAGRVLKKRVRIVPSFIYEAFAEIKLVVWPDRRNTIRLTLAVFIFAVIFASFVGLLDYGLGVIFKRLFVK